MLTSHLGTQQVLTINERIDLLGKKVLKKRKKNKKDKIPKVPRPEAKSRIIITSFKFPKRQYCLKQTSKAIGKTPQKSLQAMLPLLLPCLLLDLLVTSIDNLKTMVVHFLLLQLISKGEKYSCLHYFLDLKHHKNNEKSTQQFHTQNPHLSFPIDKYDKRSSTPKTFSNFSLNFLSKHISIFTS